MPVVAINTQGVVGYDNMMERPHRFEKVWFDDETNEWVMTYSGDAMSRIWYTILGNVDAEMRPMPV
jgi:hypothetical protein